MFLPFIGTVLGYDAKFSDGDHNMLAACSGIWVNDRGAAGSTYINGVSITYWSLSKVLNGHGIQSHLTAKVAAPSPWSSTSGKIHHTWAAAYGPR